MASFASLVLCTLFLVSSLSFSEASHFRYGTATFTKSSANPRNVTFTLQMAMRRTYFSPLPNVGSTVTDGAFAYGDGGALTIPLLVNNIDTTLDIVYVSWTGYHVYSGAGNYNAGWSSCCRIFALNNNPSYSYQVWTLLKLTAAEIAKTVPVNNSPQSSILPIIPVPYGQVPFTYQIDTSDIDGDSRTFRMATAAEQGDPSSTHPTGLSVSATGLVTLTSVLARGYWTTQQVITDSFGNSIVVDYMIDVEPPQSYCNTTGGCSTPCQSSADCAACGSASSACINALPRFVVDDLSSSNTPRTDRPTPPRSSVFSMLPNTTMTFYYTADDANLYRTATPVNIQFSSLPSRMTRSAQRDCTAANGCTYIGNYYSPQFVSLTYAPLREDAGSHVVCASAQSMANYLPYAQHCFTIVVSNITDVCGDSIVGVTEACDGGACCADDCKSYKSAGTVCGGSAGDCGSAAVCTGSSATCPSSGSFSPAGTVCRASTGPCDPAEVCSGSSVTCPANSLNSGSVCRASNGPCDVAETCDGSSAACPADSFNSGSVCRASNGPCDVAETCSGSSASCPADSFNSGSVCRASNGPCDVAETCSGSSASCPADSFNSGSVCRPSNGDCDVAETCSGSSAACPADTFAPSSSVCRASNGPCDVVETCTGSSASCPADSLNSGSVCRASNGPCDVAETCDGSSSACPADSFNSGSVCRGSAGPCDVAETCDGSSASCPADAYSSSIICRSAAGPCDAHEYCSGTSVDCPADAFISGTTCRASNGECDVAEVCSGSAADCPADAFADSSVTCRASNGVCDAAETCTGSSAACPSDSPASSTTVCRPSANGCDIADFCTGSSFTCPADARNLTAACSTAKDYCTRNQNVGVEGNSNYFCAGTGYFMQCVSGTGNFATKFPCAAGTGCYCADGIDCSFGGTQSPCTVPYSSGSY